MDELIGYGCTKGTSRKYESGIQLLCFNNKLQFASNPKYVRREEVPEEVIESEKAIAKQQAINEGKKPEMADKIVDGKITDAFRIEQSMPTINALRNAGARVAIVAHRGRPKGERNMEYTLRPIADYMNRMKNQLEQQENY